MKELLDSLRLEEVLDYMGYGKLLIYAFIGGLVLTFLLYLFVREQRWIKYVPGLLMLIYGLFSLNRIDLSVNNFLEDNSLIGFIIGMAGGFATLLFGLILGVYNKPRKKKRTKSKVKEDADLKEK